MKIKKDDKFLNILAFCILMESGRGILDKSPNYLMEKYIRYVMDKNPEAWRWGLDVFNVQKFKNYIKKWNIEIEGENLIP